MVQGDSHNSLSHFADGDAELVERQLDKIILSPHFKTAKKIQTFLQYILRKSLAGDADKLKQYTIAVEALGFPADFDTDTNPVIRIIAGRVRKRLADYYENEGVNDDLLISIPKGSYSPTFELNRRNKKLRNKEEGDSHSVPPKLAVLCYSDETQDLESNR